MFKKLITILLFCLILVSCKSKLVITDNDVHKTEKVSYVYQKKLTNDERKHFAKKLNVAPEEITNEKLYNFIKSWEETTYLYGGDTKNGIDCSSLMQYLYKYLHNVDLPRTSAEMGFDSRIKLFKSMDELQEGDLVFFRINEEKVISHVGVYLKNDIFFSAVSSEGCSMASLKKLYWKKSYIGGGRLRSLYKK